MLNEETLIAGAIATWNSNLDRANKLFCGLDEAALQKQVAPGRNRLVYLWGHLAATHDRMLQLLGIAERVHPEFDAIFLPLSDDGLHANMVLSAFTFAMADRAKPRPTPQT